MSGNTSPVLRVILSKCSGCRACSVVCALAHENSLSLNRVRIRVEKNMPGLEKPVFKPVFCRMCKNAKCIAACPTGALFESAEDHSVILDPALCDGCGLCVEACPFHAIWLDEESGNALKCDLCGGDPECVKFCSPNALIYMP